MGPRPHQQRQPEKELKDRVGDLLTGYIDDGGCVDDDVPELEEGRRSWKLGYTRFHMDVLPAVPDADFEHRHRYPSTDKQLSHWQRSDPIAYTKWFRGQCRRSSRWSARR